MLKSMLTIPMTVFIAMAISACDGHSYSPRATAGEYATFPTIGFEETVELDIPFSSARVCPLFEPDGRKFLYEWWEPIVVKAPEGETLKGLMTYTEYDGLGGLSVYLTVTKHAPADGYMQYLVLWGDFEIQRIDISCAPGHTDLTTRVVWSERNAGLHDNGVSLVSQFVEGGYLKQVVEGYGQAIEAHLKDES